MTGGHLVAFTPAEVTGIGTPVITQHLPPGAISYNANGTLTQAIGGKLPVPVQQGGRRKKSKSSKSRRSSKSSKKSSRRKSRRSSKKTRSVKRRY